MKILLKKTTNSATKANFLNLNRLNPKDLTALTFIMNFRTLITKTYQKRLLISHLLLSYKSNVISLGCWFPFVEKVLAFNLLIN